MDDTVRTQLESRVHKIEEGHHELSSSMESISKDMHILSATLVELKDVMKSLASSELEFQLFRQKTDQNVGILWDKFDELKALDKDVVEKMEEHADKLVDAEVTALITAINKYFQYTLWMVGAMLGLFLTYVAYMDVKFTTIGNSTSKVEKITTANDNQLKAMQVQTRDLYFDVKEIRKTQQETMQALIK